MRTADEKENSLLSSSEPNSAAVTVAASADVEDVSMIPAAAKGTDRGASNIVNNARTETGAQK